MFFICLCFSIGAIFPGGQSQDGSNQRQQLIPVPSSPSRTQDFFNEALLAMERAFVENDEVTPQDLYYLGRAVASDILAQYKLYTANPELTNYINLVCQAILINSPQIELYNGSQAAILDTPIINAFATPGGHIFLTKGLVEAVTSEDMLAAVIAHELAHIELRHSLSIVREMEFFYQMTGIANQAADFAGRDSVEVQRLMSFRQSVSYISETVLKNGYSRQHEFEADRRALTLLAAAGYDPLALLEVMMMLEREDNFSMIELNSTHPSPWERFSNLEAAVRLYRVPDTREYRVARFNAFN